MSTNTRRMFLRSLMIAPLAPTAALAAAIHPKQPPAEKPTLRRESNSPLTSEQIDRNFESLHERLVKLEQGDEKP